MSMRHRLLQICSCQGVEEGGCEVSLITSFKVVPPLIPKSKVRIGKGIIMSFSSNAFFKFLIAAFFTDTYVLLLREYSSQILTEKFMELSPNSFQKKVISSDSIRPGMFSMAAIATRSTFSKSSP